MLEYDGTIFTARRYPPDHNYGMAFGYFGWSHKPTWKLQIRRREVNFNECQKVVKHLRKRVVGRPARSWDVAIEGGRRKSLIVRISVNLWWPLTRVQPTEEL